MTVHRTRISQHLYQGGIGTILHISRMGAVDAEMVEVLKMLPKYKYFDLIAEESLGETMQKGSTT